MSGRRLTGLARVPFSHAQRWGPATRHHGRTFSAQDGPTHRGPEKSSLRSSETPKFSRPVQLHSTSGLGYGRNNEAGDTNRTASLDSAYLGQADDVHAMRSVYNNRLRYGTNTGVLHSDSTTPPLDRGLPRPDVANANVAVTNRTPPDNAFAATNQRPSGNIPQKHDSREYHVHKARIHASLWQQELRKQAGNLEGNSDLSSDSHLPISDSKEGKETSGWDANKTVLEDWETFDPPEGEFYDESRAKEEILMFEEFEKRRERNRIQIASFVKQHLYGRQRPVDGWKYIINNFGTDSKAPKGLGLGSRQATGNNLEKLALKRESGRLRRKA